MNSNLPACILVSSILAIALPLPAREDSGTSTTNFMAVGYPSNDRRVFTPDNPAFRYEGRIDMSRPEAPRLNWQASRIIVDFEGTELTVLMELAAGKAAVDIQIDGIPHTVLLERGIEAWQLDGSLSPGRHRLEIFKRSEASVGALRFKGLIVQEGTSLHKSPSTYRSRMIFFGDSISFGACNEDAGEDQWDDIRTHNNAKSYGNLFAREINADVQNISVSGIGMSSGWNTGLTAPQVWNRNAAVARGQLADLASWKPDVVFINLGENDASFNRSQGRPFPDSFTSVYISYVQNIRKTWPEAAIVILRGGMYHGRQDPDLIKATEDVLKAFSGDPRVFSYNFDHWSPHHPRVLDHQKMKDELVAFFRSTPALARFPNDQ